MSWRRLLPGNWAATQTPVALMVIRLLIVADTLVLAAAGGLCLVFYSRPAGVVGALLSWGLAAGLAALVPYTNPRRRDRSRW